MDGRDFCSLMPFGSGGLDSVQEAWAACERLVVFCHEHLYCDLACYLAEPCAIGDLSDAIDALKTKDKLNVVEDSGVIAGPRSPADRSPFAVPDTRIWVVMLKEGRAKELAGEIIGFLDGVASAGALNADFLARFHLDFLQAAYSALRSVAIQAHEILGDEESLELSRAAVANLSAMKAWIERAIDKVAAAIDHRTEEDTSFGRAKRYIARHLFHDISREDIAAAVGLNPDHLTRMFKKETGSTVMDWVLGQRLEYARELVIKTDMSMADIAAQIGYTNFSYFSAVFKRRFSMNPSELRKSRR